MNTIRYTSPASANPYMLNFFTDFYYEILEEYDASVDLVIDREKYYKVLGTAPHADPKNHHNIEEHKKFALAYKKAQEDYTRKISLPFVKIQGKDNVESYCIKTRKEVQKEYGLIDKLSFRTTVRFIDDDFDYSSIRRDKILDKLLNGN